MTLEAIVKLQQSYFYTNATKDVHYRKDCLERLLESIEDNEEALYDAFGRDLNKSKQEAYLMEVEPVKQEIQNQIRNLEKWSREKKVAKPLNLMFSDNRIKREPYGVVLVVAPFNYPFSLSMLPLVGAMAAGNCVVLKCSKKSEYTGKVITDIINSAFDKKQIYAIEESLSYSEILNQNYNYIFFTGSERVGKNILRAAAEKLIPVSVNLGGKCPCIIEETADIELAARCIIRGKVINAGQTCISPDYVVIPERYKDDFLKKCSEYIEEYAKDPFSNPVYPKIINLHHFMRLTKYIMGEKGLIGGRYSDEQLKIEPTIFPNASFTSDIMREEIFGPLLPVIGYSDIDDVMMEITHRPSPLAAYIFSNDLEFINLAKDHLVCGCVCINDVMIQQFNVHLPMGGVGSSGMGAYRGKASYETFTYSKSMIRTSRGANSVYRSFPFKEEKAGDNSNF